MTDRLIGRSDLLRTASRLLQRGDAGAAVVGPRGSGVSRLLIQLVADGRAQGRRVQFLVAPGPEGCLPPADPAADLLVVDDAHRLDAAAAEALRAAAVGGSVQLVAGWHTSDPVPEALGWCAASGLLARLDVTPFDVDDVVAYLESRFGAGIHRASAATLRRYGAGLPAWVVPACDAALAAGRLERRAGLWRCTAPGPPTPAMLDRARRELEQLGTADADKRCLLTLRPPGSPGTAPHPVAAVMSNAAHASGSIAHGPGPSGTSRPRRERAAPGVGA